MPNKQNTHNNLIFRWLKLTNLLTVRLEIVKAIMKEQKNSGIKLPILNLRSMINRIVLITIRKAMNLKLNSLIDTSHNWTIIMRKLKEILLVHRIKEQEQKLDSNNIKPKLNNKLGRLVKNWARLKLDWNKRLKNLQDNTKIIKETKPLY